MYMSFSPPVKTFFASIIWGFLMGILWDLNRVIKKNLKFKNKKGENLNFILDVIFFALAAVLTLTFFFMFTYGGFRAFVLAGELIGFILYFCTVTKFMFYILNYLVGFIFSVFKILEKIFKFFQNIILNLIKIINEIINKHKIKKNIVKKKK